MEERELWVVVLMVGGLIDCEVMVGYVCGCGGLCMLGWNVF